MAGKVSMNQHMAAANIAYTFSDVMEFQSEVFSGARNELANKVSLRETNLFGQTTKILDYTNADEELGVMLGAVKGGAMTSAFLTDKGGGNISGLVNKLCAQDLPAVFYVATDDANVCTYDISDSAGMVFPASAQEAVDFSILAHLSIGKSYKPFVVCLSSQISGSKAEELEFPDYEEIKKLFDYDAFCGTRARALKRGLSSSVEIPVLIDADLPEITEHYLGMIKEVLGREYKAIDYVGAADAEKVFVSCGARTRVIEAAVKKMAEAGEKVGLVRIRILAPFHAEGLKAVFPSTCKKAVLIGQGDGSCPNNPLFARVRDAAPEVEWLPDAYAVGRTVCEESYIVKAFAAMDAAKPEGSSEYFPVSMDSWQYANEVKQLLDMGEHRLVIANSVAANNIDYGLGMCVALEQRRAWIMNEVLFLADNTVYPSVSVHSYAYLDVKDDAEKSYQAGQIMLEDEVRECFSCCTCTNITAAKEMLTKKYLWIFGGDARDAALDEAAIRRAFASGENINIFVAAPKEWYKDSAANTGMSNLHFMTNGMANVLSKGISMDMEPERIEEILHQCELYAGPSYVTLYV